MQSSPATTNQTLSRTEFVALMAMLVATIAYSIDAMLPALPQIGADLSPSDPNRAQLVVGSFILGLGLGTFFVGAISDAFGRKPVLFWGAVIYVIGAALATLTPSMEALIAARILQGLGASAARIVALAIIRDLYKGREMARLMSFVMLVFALVPAVAPMAGAAILSVTGWRGIFVSFLVFAAITTLWTSLRLTEPLPPEQRNKFELRTLLSAAKEVIAHPMVRLSIAVQTLCFTMLFASISSIQQIMDQSFGRGSEFPYWFALIALVAATGSIVNASLVLRLGMRKLILVALIGQIVVTVPILALFLLQNSAGPGFFIYFPWQVTVFFMIGLTLGNLNALALEPLGHIAGMAASITTGIATVGSVVFSVPIGLAFNGTPVPLLVGVLICACVACALTQRMRGLERGSST
ncbi:MULTISPECIES: multidrug effflux MFS transporter [Roseovarius]|uniref:MFS-type drug efflux transporter P55 n=2 Tax=Roseovarius TaxID=74030 RepID=A0ABZ2HE11_9RHOB|nr:multidrug effflux MFS transporter [Roseovarius sp. W115]MDV2930758.1 multidrug effflux MFS transporter [Roseovarius sp. W115]